MDSIIEGAKIGCVRASSRIPCAADAAAIHLGTAQQIIKRAHAVPDCVAGHCIAYEEALAAENRVLGSRGADLRFAQVGIVELHALALTKRVPGQDHDPSYGEVSDDSLPDRVRLPAGL